MHSESTRHTGRSPSYALFGIAFIEGTVSVLGWWIYGPAFDTFAWIMTSAFIVYVLLAVSAQWAPLSSSWIAVGYYLAHRSVEFLMAPMISPVDVVVNLLDVLLLTAAVLTSMNMIRSRRQMSTSD